MASYNCDHMSSLVATWTAASGWSTALASGGMLAEVSPDYSSVTWSGALGELLFDPEAVVAGTATLWFLPMGDGETGTEDSRLVWGGLG